tara:strand:+ start:81 stop:665 length:585 start_codon:yes stop_codon:yes gene_type:complete
MIKLDGLDKSKVAVFISGKGSNLKNLIKFSLKKNSRYSINLIISNNPKAKGLNYSKIFKIKKKTINFKNIRKAEKILIKILKKEKIDVICLAGFMRILTKKLIKDFNGIIINIHPSLLPKYKGLDTHIRCINNKEKYSGCTVHYVNAKLDSGKIIMQKKVKIYKKDSPSQLAKRILKQEHLLYPKALNKILTSL